MHTSTLIVIILLAILVVLYCHKCSENFSIEDNTIMGGYDSEAEADSDFLPGFDGNAPGTNYVAGTHDLVDADETDEGNYADDGDYMGI